MYCWGALELTAQEKMFKHSNCLLFSFYIYVVITVFVLLQDHLLCDYIDSLPHSFPHMISAVLAISPLFVVLFGRSLQFWDLYFIRKSFLMFLWHNLVGRGGGYWFQRAEFLWSLWTLFSREETKILFCQYINLFPFFPK